VSHYVLDASVAIKSFTPETHSDIASRLVDPAIQLSAPDLLCAELGNVLWKRVRRGELTRDEAQRIANQFGVMHVRLFSARSLVRHACDLAVELDRTVYDSLYLAMAVQGQIQLVTADLRLHNTIQASRYSGRSLWIENVP